MPFDYMSENYTPFEQNLALSWTNSHFTVWYQDNRDASPDYRRDVFFQYLEGGLSLALEFRQQNF